MENGGADNSVMICIPINIQQDLLVFRFGERRLSLFLPNYMETVLLSQAMDFTLNVLSFILPAVIVFMAVYLVLQKFLEEDYKKRLLGIKQENVRTMTPLKLQAYERITLFLDRISPDNLVVRLSKSNQSADQLRKLLVGTITEEFNHNVSQQIYVSDQAWEVVVQVKEQIIAIVNQSYKELPEEAKGTDLGKAILNKLLEAKVKPTSLAIKFIKKEIELVM